MIPTTWPRPSRASLSVPAALLALVTALAVAASPGTAHASPCSSDDDDSSSDDSSSSSSSDDDSGSDWYSDDDDDDDDDATPACVNTSDIVGRSECTQFGSWDASLRPRLQLSMGISSRRAALTGMSFAGEAEHEKSISYRVPSEDVGSDATTRAITLDVRLTGSIGRLGYVGVEGSFGGAQLDDAQVVSRGDLTLEMSGGIHASVAAVAGISIPVSERFAIGAEGVAGWGWTQLTVTSRHFDCVADSMVGDGQWFVSPRLVATRWMSPYLSVSAHVGSDALREGGASVGVMLTGHGRGWDGIRSRR